MPQSTNLNKNPYYDDFSDSKNFYKVLFKPGVTVQTRELTNLQSILQNQIEKLGGAFFKKNSVVVPGGFSYDQSFYCVEIESTFKGIDVENYFENLVGIVLTGKTSNVTAKVEKVLSRKNSIRNNTTLYIKYQSSSSSNFSTNIFSDGEELVVNDNITFTNGSILRGSSVAKTIAPTNRTSTSIGSAAKIDDGIYFIRGFFVNVFKDTLILDQYTNTPSYRVGLYIDEEIIDSAQDESLYDNAQGFSNYAAPGADRLKISLSLIAKELTDFKDENFIELFRVENGNLIQIKNQTNDSYLTDILARRTFDESGNYYVSPFKVESLESLNDYLGNGGLYFKGQTTGSNIDPSEDNAVLKVSPGKAYVKGYEVPTNTEILSLLKPRTTKHIESSSSYFNAGNLLRLNNVSSSPDIELSTSYTVDLYPRRLQDGATVGTPIGIARVYDFSSNLTSYQNKASQFNIHLFDIQTYTKLISDSSLTAINVGDYIKGNNTGSTGFVQNKSGQTLTLRQVSGIFAPNETISVGGISTNTSIGTVTAYSIEDVKSLSKDDFTADLVLSKETLISGPFTLSVNSGIGTISSYNGSTFASPLKVNNVVKFSLVGVGSDVYARVTDISATKNKITVTGVSTVQGVCSGNIGVSTSLQTISLISPQIYQSDDPSLTAKLNHNNIADVNFENSNIYVKVSYDSVSKSSTTLTLPTLAGDYVYSSYDSERYTVVNTSNNSIENLDTATFTITNGGKDAQFTNLSATSGPCRVITTQKKSNVSQKFKKLSRCNSLTVSKTKYTEPPNAGLTYSSVYGTRVEDDQISLNTADILNVHAIFESSTNSDPAIPYISLSNINSVDDLIVGELIIGNTSGAVAIYAQKKDSSKIYIINKNNIPFTLGESVSFVESELTADVSAISYGDKNILNEFTLDNGQRAHFYDFGRLIKNTSTTEPSGRLTIFFDNFTYNSTDYGDIVSVNSYPSTLDKNQIPVFNGTRNTDILDIRPRVANYSASSVSPFDFGSRSFATSSNNPVQVLSPDENFIFDYDFYLPRTDKLTLSKTGAFNIVFGEPSETPVAPSVSDEVLDVATIVSSPYVYDVKSDIKIILTDNRRYTMTDLRSIDNRVSNLEYYTSLSLLEKSTENLLITDANGLNRFKSGFFVDEFNNYDVSDENNPSYRALIDNKILSAPVKEEKINLSLFYNDDYTSISDIDLANTNCNNLKITKNILSLNYSETEAIKQPFSSKVVNVNPFNIITWTGTLSLYPSTDKWVSTYKITKNTEVSDNLGHSETWNTSSKTVSKVIKTRNIAFTALNLKPNTRFKLLFDKKDLSSNSFRSKVFPKFLEITNTEGKFEIGETVTCTSSGKKVGTFRICAPNHKFGPVGAPTTVFTKNPYDPSIGISTQYGPQSTLLNIDLESLYRSDIYKFSGYVSKGNKLTGSNSKATATVSDIKLVTNDEGVLLGGIWINEKDKFTVGKATVDLNVYTQSQRVPGQMPDSSASTVYTSGGKPLEIPKTSYYDPLAQTFIVEDENGIIPTSVDVYFYTKDPSVSVTLQIREVSLGTPGGADKIVKGLEKTLNPSEVNISRDSTVKTTFKFDNLVRLPRGEYAIILISDSSEYQVWVSEVGAEDRSTVNLPAVNKVFITTQPYLGSLFKSQNGSTWVSSPLEDLKFTLNKAKFSTTGGTARFYNPTVSTINVENKLPNNPITAISTSGTPNSGRHILVFHPNHGMHKTNNKVEIAGVETDILPQILTVSYANTSTGPITVEDNSIFATFEGSAVSPSNPGYIQIANEIIKYENLGSPNTLIDITRGVYGTIPNSHSVGDLAYKYEFNNVSLNRINTTHTVLSDPEPTLDNYYIQVSAGSSFTQTKTAGGENVYASRNKQFSELTFNPDTINKFEGTQVTSTVRTITSTSVNGSEVSYVDSGFTQIGIDSTNKFDTPRMVASRVNELEYLNATSFVGNRSFTLELNLNTEDPNLSPLIDLTDNYVSAKIYNINQPIGISSYASDNRVNSNIGDPNSFIHLSSRINLQESAKSLQVLFSSYRHVSSDIRVLYKIFTNDSPDNEQVWQLFPGYDNLDVNGDVVNPANNSGSSDIQVRSSLNGEYLDYRYSIDNLSPFTGFQIKIIGTGTNQAYSPLIKELRAIALK